jgi:hypothetical protein
MFIAIFVGVITGGVVSVGGSSGTVTVVLPLLFNSPTLVEVQAMTYVPATQSEGIGSCQLMMYNTSFQEY